MLAVEYGRSLVLPAPQIPLPMVCRINIFHRGLPTRACQQIQGCLPPHDYQKPNSSLLLPQHHCLAGSGITYPDCAGSPARSSCTVTCPIENSCASMALIPANKLSHLSKCMSGTRA